MYNGSECFNYELNVIYSILKYKLCDFLTQIFKSFGRRVRIIIFLKNIELKSLGNIIVQEKNYNKNDLTRQLKELEK